VTRRLSAFALWLGLALAAALAAWPARAQDVLPVPALSGRVIDQTGTLAPGDVAALEAKLAAFERENGSQVVLLMVPTTQPEDIAAYAQRIGDTWKIGRRDIGDGLLIVIALNDRRINIQTTKALEGAIPDLAARQIVDRVIKPAFRAGDFAGGLNAALDQLFALIRGEALPLPGPADGGSRGSQQHGLGLEGLLIFFFVGVTVAGTVFTRIFGRKLGSLVTAGAAGGVGWLFTASILAGVAAGVVALILVGLFGIGAASRGLSRGSRTGVAAIIWGGGGGGWGGGGGGGWGGGGGFSSGGGGDFGGGGASGGW
jgi:uncharacterized protein